MTAGFIPTVTADDTFPRDRLAVIAAQLPHFGFTQITEQEGESKDRATVEGWRHTDWRSELTWNLATGQGRKEKLEYGVSSPWGMAAEAIVPLVDHMMCEIGFTEIESLEIETDGDIEFEGKNHDTESVTLRTRLEAFRATR